MIQKFRKESDIFMKKLSKRQYEIMCIMWNADRPLLASEIVKSRDDLNINTVQSSLKSLVEKEYIEVADITHSRTVLARTYQPLVSKELYLQEMCSELDDDLGAWGIVAALAEQETDIRKLDKLEKLIAAAKKKLQE